MVSAVAGTGLSTRWTVAAGLAGVPLGGTIALENSIVPVRSSASSLAWRSNRAGPGARAMAFIESIRRCLLKSRSRWFLLGRETRAAPQSRRLACRGDAEMLEIGEERGSWRKRCQSCFAPEGNWSGPSRSSVMNAFAAAQHAEVFGDAPRACFRTFGVVDAPDDRVAVLCIELGKGRRCLRIVV